MKEVYCEGGALWRRCTMRRNLWNIFSHKKIFNRKLQNSLQYYVLFERKKIYLFLTMDSSFVFNTFKAILISKPTPFTKFHYYRKARAILFSINYRRTYVMIQQVMELWEIIWITVFERFLNGDLAGIYLLQFNNRNTRTMCKFV